MRNDHRHGAEDIAARMSIEDAAIAVCEAMKENYRQRAAVWQRICELRAAGDISPITHLVAKMLLFEFWNARTGVCFPKKKTIQAKLEAVLEMRVSMSTVKRALRRLRNFGLLSWIPQRFPQVVIEHGRAVWKCVQGPNLYHFTPEKFCMQAADIAKKALHLAKKKAALAAATAMRKAAKALADAATRAITVLSGGQVRTGEPAASVSTVSVWKTVAPEDAITARMDLARKRRAERLAPRTVFSGIAEPA